MVQDPTRILRDPERLAALAETELVGSPPEEEFDRLARLAARALDAATAMVSFLDGDRHHVKSLVGLPPGTPVPAEIPLEHSLCKHAVAGGRPLALPDTAADPRAGAAAAAGVAAYLGVPLTTREGLALGTLCVTSAAPRAWSPGDVAALADVAALVMGAVERRRSEADARRTEEALFAAEAMFRALVEQSLAGIYVVEDGRLGYVNPRFAEIFGQARERLMGGELLDLVDPADRAVVAALVLHPPAEGGAGHEIRHTFRGRRADGSPVYVELHGTHADVDGRPALIGVALDITERVRAESEREAATAARDRFYAMVSHELRTPISAIMLYNELLVTEVYGALTEPQREALGRSQKSARHLLELINDLLDLSKLEAGKMERRLEEVEVAELVEGVYLAVSALAREHGCEVALRIGERPLGIMGDARRIRQIVLNLLSNAVKFGEGRPVEVRAGRVRGGVVVEVADHGPGIAPEDVERIFDDFVQLGDVSAEGTGLGLPIARRLAHLMGGRIDVESQPGAGSTFRLYLPEG